MKKRVTYEIHGQIERNSYFRIGKALVRIEFTGGSINSTGVIPAQYTTENALFQSAIENSEAFRTGEIKRGRVEVAEGATERVPECANEADAVGTEAITSVTNMQQARAILLAPPYSCPLSELQNKSAIRLAAQQKGLSFPNWL